MKYTDIISESLNQTALKKVRIKVDPAAAKVSEDLAKCNGYEGYVLAEDTLVVKIIIMQPGQDDMTVMEVPHEHIEKQIKPTLANYKSFIINALNIEDNDPIIELLRSSESINDIETFLKDRGMTDEDIVNLYKYYSHE